MIRPQSIQPSQADRTKDAALCDALADGMSFRQAAAQLGVAVNAVYARFRRICRELGDQAR